MLTVEHWPIARLAPYERNPRRNDAAVDRMCAAIQTFGFRIPVVARSDGTVVDGHLRLKAAQRLGLSEIPVALADDLSDAEIKAFRLLANRSATWAAWDEDLLKLELNELNGIGFDLGLTGFDSSELQSLMDESPTTGLTDEDSKPVRPDDPVTGQGDLILLGEHRLLCGDCTNPAHVDRLLDGTRPHVMVTDPPYGVAYDPAWRNRMGISATARTGRVANDDRADWREAWALFRGDVAYIWCASLHLHEVAQTLASTGFELRVLIIWAKNRLVLSQGHYHWQHEPCWYAVRKGAPGHWQGARDQSTVWSLPMVAGADTRTAHGTQKPVEAMRRPLVNSSARGDTVYDPFAGSGTTIIAAETVGRTCLAMELDPTYCDVIVARWQAFTGQVARRVTEDVGEEVSRS